MILILLEGGIIWIHHIVNLAGRLAAFFFPGRICLKLSTIYIIPAFWGQAKQAPQPPIFWIEELDNTYDMVIFGYYGPLVSKFLSDWLSQYFLPLRKPGCPLSAWFPHLSLRSLAFWGSAGSPRLFPSQLRSKGKALDISRTLSRDSGGVVHLLERKILWNFRMANMKSIPTRLTN